MAERYLKVSVEFGHMEVDGKTVVGAFLRTGPTSRLTAGIGVGSTEEEAFSDLLKKRGFEEAK